MSTERLAWSGTCDDCYAVTIVFPHDDSTEETRAKIAEGPDEWDAFTDCYVCDGSISWNGSDPVASVVVAS